MIRQVELILAVEKFLHQIARRMTAGYSEEGILHGGSSDPEWCCGRENLEVAESVIEGVI
jgi:hypothetical protein